MKKQFQNILTFVIIFLIVNLVFSFFFKPNTDTQTQNSIVLAAIHKDFEVGSAVSADLINNTSNDITLKNICENEPPLTVLSVKDNQPATPKTITQSAGNPCINPTDVVIKPGEKHTFTFSKWDHALFGETGKYKFQATIWTLAQMQAPGTTEQGNQTSPSSQTLQTTNGTSQAVAENQIVTSQAQTAPSPVVLTLQQKTIESDPFEMKPQGFLGWLWTIIFYQPIYNTLILLISIIPGHGLGLGIIILTLLIRTILLVPNQRALISQRKLQDIQPKLNKIREKYKDNQEMIGKETMAIMQESKVNPLGSCLPLLIQFPVLIALYYAVQNGLNPDNSYLLYGSLKTFDYSQINVIFLGILDLTKVNAFVLPIFVGGLQFLQMKLAMAKNNKAQKDAKNNKEKEPKKKTEMDTANSMMLYVMPAMIAIFTASVPAGVGIYWSVSTLYGIGQQLVVNKKVGKEHVKVRVIESPKK